MSDFSPNHRRRFLILFLQMVHLLSRCCYINTKDRSGLALGNVHLDFEALGGLLYLPPQLDYKLLYSVAIIIWYKLGSWIFVEGEKKRRDEGKGKELTLTLILKVKVLVAQSCPTLCDLMDCSPPGFSVHGILQVRILEWVAIPFSRGSYQTRDQTWVSCIAGRFLTVRVT